MKEIVFIKRNKQKWEAIDKAFTNSASIEADRMVDLYMEITSDLAYSNTYYPGSETSQYLNLLALNIHQKINRVPDEKTSRFVTLFTTSIPQLFYKHRKYMLISLLIFVVSIIIGLLSFAEESRVANSVLGEHYIAVTQDNIDKNDPMGIYSKMEESVMFVTITMNNIMVAFLTFLFGILSPLGTIYYLINNGLMVGVFQAYFLNQDLLFTSTLAIMIHGTLELSAIVLAGAAGLALGANIFFPGTHSRKESFKKAAKEGVIMLIGLVPVFIIAGFIEAYITRHYKEMPLLLNLTIIVLSLTLIIWYFVIYPHQISKEKRGYENITKD